MWSKRRKKFARKYDADKHRLYLFTCWLQLELTKRICDELDRAILFGIKDDDEQRHRSYGLTIADEIIKKCF